MADTAARTRRLLSLLQRRRYWAGPDLAERLGVSDRTLRRDIERLRELGYAVEADRGVDGGYRLGGTTGDAPLLLDVDEATALAAALHTATGGGSELAEASLGALTKVLAMLGPEARRRVETVRAATAFGASEDGEAPALAVLDAVGAACRDQVRLSFAYVAADGVASDRYVEPCRLVALDGRWYLVAFDVDRAGWRTFRVDRVADPIPAHNTFTPRPPPAPDLAEYVRMDMGERDPVHRIVIEIDRSGDEVRAAYGAWAEIDDLLGDRCRLTMETTSFRWPTHIVADVGVPVRVISPPRFRAHLRTLAAHLRHATAPTSS